MCVHHWRIEPPEGEESHGVCTKCGEQKSFSNTPVTGRPMNGEWGRRSAATKQAA
jgi:hypothetical protein